MAKATTSTKTDDKTTGTQSPAGDPSEVSSGANVGPEETGSAKAANDQAASTDAVVESDPTAANPRVAEAGNTTAGVGENSVLIKADGSIDGSLFSDAPPQEFVTVEKDIVQEFYYPNTSRPAYKILYTAGQTVPKKEIDALQAAAAAADGLQGHIDSTTYASGTALGAAIAEDENA